MMASYIPRFIRTAAHLHPSQLAWRVRYGLERRLPCMPILACKPLWRRNAPPKLADSIPSVPLITRHGSAAITLDLLNNGVIQHLHQQGALGHAHPDWRLGDIHHGRLWAITLHYHEWVYDLAETIVHDPIGSGAANSLLQHFVSDWLDRCWVTSPGARALAWNAYATATRITWWMRALQLLGPRRIAAWGHFGDRMMTALWDQAAYLSRHIEWDLMGNHVLRDAAGLAWAGRGFAEPEAEHWLATATRIALRQAETQILRDGGHYERSPMYHILAIEDLLAVRMLTRDDDARVTLDATLRRMAEVAAWMTHPDGRIPLFNDAALNGAAASSTVMDALKACGILQDAPAVKGGHQFPDIGMLVWHSPRWSVFFDTGLVGPNEQPGHAHADTLSVECSLDGQRLFVDPGTFHYDDDEYRRFDRSTRSHNTVCIDGQDSSEMWSIFRVGRRAKPIHVAAVLSDDMMEASGSHDGFDHLPGRPRHTRTLSTVRHAGLMVVDRIEGGGVHTVEGGFLLAPNCQAVAEADGWQVVQDRRRILIRVQSSAPVYLSTDSATYHPEFGLEEITHRLGWRYTGPLPVEVTITTEPIR